MAEDEPTDQTFAQALQSHLVQARMTHVMDQMQAVYRDVEPALYAQCLEATPLFARLTLAEKRQYRAMLRGLTEAHRRAIRLQQAAQLGARQRLLDWSLHRTFRRQP